MAPVLTRSVDYERFLYDAGGQAELSVTEYWAVLTVLHTFDKFVT